MKLDGRCYALTMRELCALGGYYARTVRDDFVQCIEAFYYTPLGFSDARTMRELCAIIFVKACSRSTIRRSGFPMRLLCANYARQLARCI